MADSRDIAAPSPTTRSRITNGSALLEGVDGRSAGARRYRDIRDGLLTALGRPLRAGEDGVLAALAGAVLDVERLNAATVRGEKVDPEQRVLLCNAVVRLRQALGLKPSKAEEAGPDLESYIAERSGARP